VRWRICAVAFAACGRIDFQSARDARIADASAADAFPAVVIVSDDFDRSVGSGWGSADIGGVWFVFNPDASAVSVAPGKGSVAIAGTSGYADFHVTSTTALDTETSAIVSFDRLPATASYTATLSARWVADGTDYRFHVDVLAGGALDVFLESGSGSGYVTLQTGSTTTTLAAGDGLALALDAIGASPTMLCGKLWLAGSPEPSACTVTVQDSAPALQVPGISYLVTYDSGDPPPTVSFATFRYLRIGSM